MTNHDRHERRKAELVSKAIARREDMERNVLAYAQSGERLATFTQELAAILMDLLFEFPPRHLSRGLHAAMHRAEDMLIQAHTELEPWRSRVCLCVLDDIVTTLTDDDSDGPDDHQDETPPPTTPVPAAFIEAMA